MTTGKAESQIKNDFPDPQPHPNTKEYDDDWDDGYHNVKQDQTDDSQFAFDGYPD